MAKPHPSAPEPSRTLLAAVRRLLRPLIGLLVARGITLPALVEMLKGLYVEVTEREFRLPGRAQTDSRISMLTGVHRKDVKRLRGAAAETQPAAPSTGIQVVSTWLGDARFLTARGRPRILPLRAADSGEPSFEGLVGEVCRQNIRPRAVLDELLRQGMVEVDERQRVHLQVDAFVPDADSDEQAVYFGRNLRDHIAAGAHNLLGREPRLFDRSVHYGGLSAEDVAELTAQAERMGMEVLKTVNRRALGMKRANAGVDAARHRVNLGVYFYTSDAPEDDDEPGEES